MTAIFVLSLVLAGQGSNESPFNTYGVSLGLATMPGGCRQAETSHFGNRAYRFRDTPMYPHDQPLVFTGGRALERNSLGSIEWESTLRRADPIEIGAMSAVLLEILADHVGGTGGILYVLIVRCRPDRLDVLFEARGPIRHVAYRRNGGLTLDHGLWSRDDSHASPSREVTERYQWAAQRNRFELVETTERRLRYVSGADAPDCRRRYAVRLHASNIVAPPTTVRTMRMSLRRAGSTSCGSSASITKSASLPAVIDPLVDSSNDA